MAFRNETIESHREYLLSDIWKERRIIFLLDHGYHCDNCGGTFMIQVHHLSYDYAEGCEPNTELMALCIDCHKKAHEDLQQ